MKIETLRAVAERDSRAIPEAVLRRAEALRAGPAPDASMAARLPAARIAARGAHLAEGGRRPSRTEQERMLGTNDLVDVNYLERGIEAARAVCRVVLRDGAGRELGTATGFKVAPTLLITNHHVLPDAATAAQALAQFDHELDILGRPRPTTQFRLLPGAFFLADAALDFALVALDPQPAAGAGVPLERYGWLRLNKELAKINAEIEFVTIIQHPTGLSKQVSVRENRLLKIDDPVLWYACDTAPGSSGAPVLNDSWQAVGLHRSGVPRKNAAGDWLRRDGGVADDDTDDSEIDWIANAGVRVSRIVERVERGGAEGSAAAALTGEFLAAARTEAPVERTTGRAEAGSAAAGSGPVPVMTSAQPALQPIPGGARLVLPLSIDIHIGGLVGAPGGGAVPSTAAAAAAPASPLAAPAPASAGAAEALRIPWIDLGGYGNRRGYQTDFLLTRAEREELGTADAARRKVLQARLVPFPAIDKPAAHCALLAGGGHVIPYHNFSLAMHRARRLALVTASNVDHREASQKPEAGRSYTREALTGLGKNDSERWITDERIAQDAQLPDQFFTRDRNAFDKGHLVRRDDVAWGDSWEAVRRANGDTYHTTNCSPQVLGFNRSQQGGTWGRLENLIGDEGEGEPYCVFAGPVLDPQDRVFHGVDDVGRRLSVKIPRRYWKLVVARKGNALQAFGFVLEQDLGGVDWEFAVPSAWTAHKRGLAVIEALIARSGAALAFGALRAADQWPGAGA
ncbi:MAG: DNA/RNA non-specific endonuclease [Acetobacteraceae bacterium]|nr:DNA/RNA non-specific endonuclease [Acetobacteraceae bacterium]